MKTMNHPLESSSSTDLQFATSVDTSIQQNVSVPSQPPTLNATSTNQGIPAAEEETVIARFFKNSGHPGLCILHVIFKALAVVVYLFGGLFEHGTNFITVTVACILLLACDFWVVKNITGRLLVGLRWWAQIEGEDGTETRWIFEAAPADSAPPNKFDSTWFWGVLYVTPLVWGAFFFIGLLKWNFGWLITVAFAIALSVANVYGYWQCSKDQKAKFQQMVQRGAQYGAGAAIRNNVFGKMAGFASKFGGTAGQSQGQPQETVFV